MIPINEVNQNSKTVSTAICFRHPRPPEFNSESIRWQRDLLSCGKKDTSRPRSTGQMCLMDNSTKSVHYWSGRGGARRTIKHVNMWISREGIIGTFGIRISDLPFPYNGLSSIAITYCFRLFKACTYSTYYSMFHERVD